MTPEVLRNKDDELVVVCSECLTAACWNGIFYCQEYKTAGTKSLPRRELRMLALENPCYFYLDKNKEE